MGQGEKTYGSLMYGRITIRKSPRPRRALEGEKLEIRAKNERTSERGEILHPRCIRAADYVRDLMITHPPTHGGAHRGNPSGTQCSNIEVPYTIHLQTPSFKFHIELTSRPPGTRRVAYAVRFRFGRLCIPWLCILWF